METLIVILIILGAITFLSLSLKRNLKAGGCSGCSEKNKCGQTFEFPPTKEDK